MPAHTRTPQVTTTPPTTGTGTGTGTGPATTTDLTGGRGNAAMNDTLPGLPEDSSLLAEEPQRRRERSEDVAGKVTLAPGRKYVVTGDDMGQGDPWRAIARNHGMSPENLQAFNQHVIEVEVGGTT